MLMPCVPVCRLLHFAAIHKAVEPCGQRVPAGGPAAAAGDTAPAAWHAIAAAADTDSGADAAPRCHHRYRSLRCQPGLSPAAGCRYLPFMSLL